MFESSKDDKPDAYTYRLFASEIVIRRRVASRQKKKNICSQCVVGDMRPTIPFSRCRVESRAAARGVAEGGCSYASGVISDRAQKKNDVLIFFFFVQYSILLLCFS